MGLIEDLAQARDAYERREWAASYEALCRRNPRRLRGDDFARLATAALLLGRRNDAVQAMQRAYQVKSPPDSPRPPPSAHSGWPWSCPRSARTR